MARKIDVANGSLFKNMLLFAVPIILTGVLQLLYNAADVIVVGRFAGRNSLAAVGATSSLINLLTNLFIGLSVGTNVCIAQLVGLGGKDSDDYIKKSVHTSVLIALIGGAALLLIGVFTSKKLLLLMDTPLEILDESSLYMTIIFLGMPAMLVYNFGAAVLRACGDTKTPLIYLSVSGILNVILNLIFVIVFKMGAEGVGIATVISQYLCAALIVLFLMKQDSAIKLRPKELKIDTKMLKKILKIGLPAGIQGTVFSISNVIIQSSINGFGAAAIAGNSAASNIEGFTYTAMNAFSPTLSTFVGQSYGAGNVKRIKKSVAIGCFQVFAVGVIMSFSTLLFANQLLGVYSSDKAVIESGIERMTVILSTYFLCGLMDTLVGSIRGMGISFLPMCATIFGVCGIRIAWIFTVFKSFKTLETLYASYPVSWLATVLVQVVFLFVAIKKTRKRFS